MKVFSGCVININNDLLVLRNKNNELYLPEVEINDSELLKVACIRGVKELTSFNVLPNALFGVYDAIDRGYPERTLGVYYITNLDIETEHAKKLIEEQNNSLKTQNEEYTLELLPITDIGKDKMLYDHSTLLHNYLRILMLGQQTFKMKKE